MFLPLVLTLIQANPQRVAFLSAEPGSARQSIHVANVDGTGLRRLTKSPSVDESVAWSPKGDWLVFTRGASLVDGIRKDATSHIFIVRPDGTGLKQLTSGAHQDRMPAWQDSGRISFTRWAKNRQRLEVRIDGKATMETDWPLAWASPDGRWSFVAEQTKSGPANMEMWLRRIGAEAEAVKIGSAEDQVREATWSSDSKTVAVVLSSRDGMTTELQSVSGGERKILRPNSKRLLHSPSFSPNGQQILFLEESPISRKEGLVTSDLCVMNADGTAFRRLSQSGDNSSPTWTRDGRGIVFTMEFPAKPGEMPMVRRVIAYVDVATGKVRTLPIPGNPSSPVLSP